MSVSSEYNAGQNQLKIKIDGRFDYDSHQQFTAAYKDLPGGSSGKKIIIDLSRVDYMDSSALGMLLVLRERAGGDRSDITLNGAVADIQKILDIANFEKLFKVK